MLKGKRLYRDKSGTLWHLRSDGSGITYPTFVAENKFPSMLDGYEEIVPNDFYNKSSGVDLKDQLYLCEYTENHSVSLLAVEDTCINTERNFLAYNIMNDSWLNDFHDCKLFPMPDLIPGCEYQYWGSTVIFDCYDSRYNRFVFWNNYEEQVNLKINELCYNFEVI